MHNQTILDPGDEYLQKIGEISYMVGWVEWQLISDTHRFQRFFPGEPHRLRLTSAPTGIIARELGKFAETITYAPVQDYYRVGAEVLGKMATLRNNVLHARPSSDDLGMPLLRRWRFEVDAFGSLDILQLADLDRIIVECSALVDQLVASRDIAHAIPYKPRDSDAVSWNHPAFTPADEYDLEVFGPDGPPRVWADWAAENSEKAPEPDSE